MRPLNTPFIIITIAVVFGIILGSNLNIQFSTSLSCFFVSVILLYGSWRGSRKMFQKNTSFTYVMILVFICFGVVLTTIHDPKNDPKHYTNQFSSQDFNQNSYGVQFHIKERLKPTSYYEKYIVSIIRLGNNAVRGKILLQIPKKDISKTLNIGSSYTSFVKITPISKPLNPYQFDYAKHLRKQYVYHKININKGYLINHHQIRWSLSTVAAQFRTHINSKLSEYPFTPKQRSIINALLLGQRHDIDQETFNAYRDAGAIHILAISGLHIGIIFLIINFVLTPITWIWQRSQMFKTILTIILLWCFALVTGLSPSVLRAVTMFSFLAIGIQLKSKNSIYNALFVSMFILLCFNPNLLFSVGFQLSYIAVFSIIWIQPILANQYRPKFYIIGKLWDNFTVTIAAQLGLLPLTLFYFHQFPLLFFVSNLIIIPFLGMLLGLGIITLALASLEFLPKPLAFLFGKCIDAMNITISWIAEQEEFIITNIPFSWRMLILLYLLIIVIFLKFKKKKILWICLSITLIISTILYEKQKALEREEFIIFNNHRNTTVGYLKNQKLKVYSKKKIKPKTQHFLFSNYLTHNQATLDTNNLQLKNMYQYKQYVIMIIDCTSIYQIKEVRPDILLLSNSPKINMTRVLDSLKPKQVIADNSSYKSYIDRWKESCKKHKIPFYQIDKRGAYILK